MSNKLLTMAIPSNPKAKEDVFPILAQSLALEKCESGIYKSPYLPETRIVEVRLKDVVRFLRDGVADIGVMGADVGIEAIQDSNGNDSGYQPYQRFYRPNPKLFNGKRKYGLRIEKPAKMRYLVREEEAAKFGDEFYRVEESADVAPNAVTSYPWTLSWALRSMNYFERCGRTSDIYDDSITLFAPRSTDKLKINRVDGQVESYLRNGVFPNTVFAMDLVRSGQTAKRFGLVPIKEPILTAYPSVWTYPNVWSESLGKSRPADPRAEDIVQEIKVRLAKNVPIEE